MAKSVGAGSTVSIASAYGVSKNMTAITNATEAVATLEASHGIVVGDYFEVTSGWARLTGRVVRAKAVATNDVTLEGVDTTSITDYPTGAGTGTVREISTWTQISNVKSDSFSVSGGEQQYADATSLESPIETQLPTMRSAYQVSFSVMDSSAGLTAARAVGITPTAVRITLPGPVNTVGNAYWSVSDVPNISGREVTTYKVDLTFSSKPITY